MPSRLLTDQEAEEIRREFEAGERGPRLVKFIRLLLEDREERVRLESGATARDKDPRQFRSR